MIEALWIDVTGKRTNISRTDDGRYEHGGAPLPNGHYVFDLRTWRHVVYGPYDTAADASEKYSRQHAK